MLAKITQFFSENLELREKQSKIEREDALKLASAALLVEVSRADFDIDAKEQAAVIDTLKKQFELSNETVESLISLAESEVEESVSLHQFTRLVNDHYNPEQKLALIESMWKVAFADGEIDKYEDYLIRKVADLIYVSHSEFIRCKLKAQSAYNDS
ncbi:TerB family tellurite resistance protein [Motiliproteus sp. MSK22-1]|uniref:tellurite resistance TerB family protein n=1 Tax=Motiliproteus sp. MSK22-1 TaxID=1897630 RepID=UPI0009761C6F|nr:TerB family tellurite resistance protein [Motiliproteus sp. MSK22-1]OMH33293.1 hypothetical protein BGP75_13700 [Motiliproteus sp. MSK22-1]